jgi:hypothetical protein
MVKGWGGGDVCGGGGEFFCMNSNVRQEINIDAETFEGKGLVRDMQL